MIDSVGGPLPYGAALRADEAHPDAAAAKREEADGKRHARLEAEAGESHAARLPDRAPERVDADVWSHLSSDEKDYFARAEALGPLTYGRGAQAAPATPGGRGANLDIRG